MKQTVTESIFLQRFEDMNRGSNFSYAGRRALFAHLEELEESTGQEIEFDVIEICCDWAEHDNVEEVIQEYCLEIDREEFSDPDDPEELERAVAEHLQDRGGDPVIFDTGREWDNEKKDWTPTRRAWLVQAH